MLKKFKTQCTTFIDENANQLNHNPPFTMIANVDFTADIGEKCGPDFLCS